MPWLRRKLEVKGFEVHSPAMPDVDNPRIETWVPFLAKHVGKVDEDTYFVGHSVGCQTILRYLEGTDAKVGGVVCVAGWFNLLPQCIPTEEEKAIAKPWLETSVDFEKVRKVANKVVAIFSDNDEAVPLSDAKIFEEHLGAQIIIERGQGHFSGADNINELPVALKSLLKMSGTN